MSSPLSAAARPLAAIALAAALLVAGTPAWAADVAPVAELVAAADEAAAVAGNAESALAAHDARLAAARAELAAVESRLPSGPREEVRAAATAFGAMFSPKLLVRAEAIVTDERTRDALAEEIARLESERSALAQDAADANLRRSVAAARLAEGRREDAERARAESIAANGLFPVAGPNSYIDSWGFARSGGRSHKGADIFADRGTPVVACRDGWVEASSNRLGGLTVWLTGDDGARYYYAHLDTVAVGGGRVVTGQVLGTVGDTGNARGTSPHLHFEIHNPGVANPFPALQLMVR